MPPPEMLRHYDEVAEAERLLSGSSQIELLRTQEFLTRWMPRAPAVVLDVGGGPGVYSAWLAALKHQVHLIDPVTKHIEQARAIQGLASARVGDARELS